MLSRIALALPMSQSAKVSQVSAIVRSIIAPALPKYTTRVRHQIGQMLVLITYDVNTETAAGKKRLRKVAKQCENYGRRVQNSVFECIVDNAQCVMLKALLNDIIDENVDSLRLYYLGNKYQTKVEHFGVDRGIQVDQPLIL